MKYLILHTISYSKVVITPEWEMNKYIKKLKSEHISHSSKSPTGEQFSNWMETWIPSALSARSYPLKAGPTLTNKVAYNYCLLE